MVQHREDPPGATSAHGRKAERQAQIAERVLERGQAAASDLAEHFGVSVMTIHRDLDALAEQGILRRFHGGASAQRSSVFEPDVDYRLRLGATAKRAIAIAARDLVEPGMALMLDDSTTGLALAGLIADIPDLTIATNFVDAVGLLAGRGPHVIGLGGDLSVPHRSFLGHGCLDAVAAIRVNTLFSSTSAMTADAVYHQEQEIVTVKQAMMASAERRVLLMDHSKCGKSALYRVSAATDWDVIVVDAETDPTFVADLRERGIDVVVATAS
ncbi:DeoR/GlpR family DNA-binding transcription regulator [Pseudactinotalea sp.]|uniref:DeoR/GlpR family DNA-binding transcription regulator n=1 Tax=Pseudactinotalea sp. TaxID=1926260 RepID=UPI003B3A8445